MIIGSNAYKRWKSFSFIKVPARYDGKLIALPAPSWHHSMY